MWVCVCVCALCIVQRYSWCFAFAIPYNSSERLTTCSHCSRLPGIIPFYNITACHPALIPCIRFVFVWRCQTTDFSIAFDVSIFNANDRLPERTHTFLYRAKPKIWCHWKIDLLMNGSLKCLRHFFPLILVCYVLKCKITKKFQLPMPTWPAFSSDGVPGPLAGRESAPSVAL